MHNIRLNFNQLLNSTLLRQACMLCKARNGGDLALCDACLHDLPYHRQAQCPQCALPSFNNQTCGHCLKSPPAFDATRAVFKYDYPIANMLQRYKYAEMLSIANTFAALITQQISPKPLFDALIPMPLHPQRLKERGFNQSLEIAKIVSHHIGIRLEKSTCKRIKYSPPQASLDLKERVKNMRGAFACEHDLTGQRIVLLDDVMTTGASLHALAETVKKSGAAYVECWTVARTLPR